MRSTSGRWHHIDRRWVIVVVAVIAALLYWWWPGLSGQGSDIDVSIRVTSEFVDGRQSIERRLREEGWRTEWSNESADWCHLADAVATVDPDADSIVIWGPDLDSCASAAITAASVMKAAAGHRVFVVATSSVPGAMTTALTSAGATVVPAHRLLGDPGQEMDCLWWEDCPAEGRMSTWNGPELSTAGYERVARSIVAALR